MHLGWVPGCWRSHCTSRLVGAMRSQAQEQLSPLTMFKRRKQISTVLKLTRLGQLLHERSLSRKMHKHQQHQTSRSTLEGRQIYVLEDHLVRGWWCVPDHAFKGFGKHIWECGTTRLERCMVAAAYCLRTMFVDGKISSVCKIDGSCGDVYVATGIANITRLAIASSTTLPPYHPHGKRVTCNKHPWDSSNG